MRVSRIAQTFVVAALAVGCGDRGPASQPTLTAAVPRQTVVWVDEDGLYEGLERELQRVGVDQLVVSRGSVNLSSGAPVLRLVPEPPLAGVLPAGLVLRVDGAPADLEPDVADALWAGLASELGDTTAAEIILDLPAVPVGLAPVVQRFAAIADVRVLPMLVPDQLHEQEAIAVVEAAGGCVVPTHGAVEVLRPGSEPSNQPLVEQLESLAGLPVRVRLAVAIRPLARPALESWGDDLNPLCEEQVATISTSSSLDRTFSFERELTWSGRTWVPGDRLALQWMDAARLQASLVDIGRVTLPELAGWDLVALPPEPRSLGMGYEALLRYLAGDGPAPEVTVEARRSGRSLRVRMINTGPFVSAVSGYGNWVEVSVTTGTLVAEDRGSFNRIILGTLKQGQWKQVPLGGADAVRFLETYVGPDEELETGVIRLPTSRARALVRWHLVLSNGEEITGELVR